MILFTQTPGILISQRLILSFPSFLFSACLRSVLGPIGNPFAPLLQKFLGGLKLLPGWKDWICWAIYYLLGRISATPEKEADVNAGTAQGQNCRHSVFVSNAHAIMNDTLRLSPQPGLRGSLIRAIIIGSAFR